MKVYGKVLTWLNRFRWFSWISYTLLVPVDRFLYARTGGKVSLVHVGRAEALPTLMLVTRGARSGKERVTPLVYVPDGDGFAVVGSNFGREQHPAWTANLRAHPDAVVRIHEQEIPVRARELTDEQFAAVWPRLLAVYPSWRQYRTRTDRHWRAFHLARR